MNKNEEKIIIEVNALSEKFDFLKHNNDKQILRVKYLIKTLGADNYFYERLESINDLTRSINFAFDDLEYKRYHLIDSNRKLLNQQSKLFLLESEIHLKYSVK